MARVTHSVDLPVDSGAAFALWMDIEAFPTFMESVQKVELIDSRRSYWEIRVGGIEWEYDALVTSYKAGQRIEWTSTSGELDLVGWLAFADLPGGRSRLTVEIVWEPHTVVEHVGALFRDDSRTVQREIDSFAAHVATATAAAEDPRSVAD